MASDSPSAPDFAFEARALDGLAGGDLRSRIDTKFVGELDDIRRHPWWQRSPAPTALTVGVTHAPYRRVLDAFTDLGADIIFGGHTHGGQVRIPFSRSALVANCDIPRDQARDPFAGACVEHRRV